MKMIKTNTKIFLNSFVLTFALSIQVVALENSGEPKIIQPGAPGDYSKILDASSFKLNWILDPFMRSGDVGVSSKKTGRRFIGFEANKDLLLMSMKRIDQNDER